MTDKTQRRRFLSTSLGAAAAAMAAPAARAQGLPGGAIRMVIGYAPGGGTDVIARFIADKLREHSGMNVLVENRPGASGILAPAAMKGAATDGSVILLTPSVSTIEQIATRKSMPFDLNTDLLPVTLAGTVATVYAVSSAINVSTLPEYVAWLKKNPKNASFGTAAMGSTTHFFGVELGQAVGVVLEPVPYKGTGPLLTDIVAGHIPAGCGGVTSFLQHHRSGKVRILAVSGAKRATAASDLPTVTELGYPKLTSEGFYSFYLPAKTSPAVVDTWNSRLAEVLALPDLRKKLVELGLEVQTSTPAELAERQGRALVAFTASMKAAGYKPE
jgi:tripartite-type tricarboxylate transporter receptor subunit TctC